MGARPPRSMSARIWLLAWSLFLLLWCSVAVTLPKLKLTDEVSPYEERFGPLKRWIPKNTTLSLVTNIPSTEASLLGREHFLAQYMLAPTIVVRDQTRPYVLVSVYGNLPPLAPEALLGLVRVVDLGNGVALYRRSGP